MSSQAKVILLVDSDPKGRRVLEVSLRKAGYNCVCADDTASALDAIGSQHPDLILADTVLADGSGFDLCREVKSLDGLDEVPFIFLTQSHDMADKLQGYELGVDDYLAKPVFVKEVLARVSLLLERRAKALIAEADAQSVEGTLSGFSLTDIFQTLEDGAKTGALRIESSAGKGTVYFEDGAPLDARAGSLAGAEAVFRMLGWSDGSYVIKYLPSVRRTRRIEASFTDLVVEGIQREEDADALLQELGGIETVLRIDFARFADLEGELPDEADEVVNLFDGRRSIGAVVAESTVGDLAALQIIARLRDEGLLILVVRDEEDDFDALARVGLGKDRADLGTWLSGEHSVVRRDASRALAEREAAREAEREAKRLAEQEAEAARLAEEERLKLELEALRLERENEAERAREAGERQRALERQERELQVRLSGGALPVADAVSGPVESVPSSAVASSTPEITQARDEIAALDRTIAEERARLDAARARAEAQAELVAERERLHREAQVRTAELEQVRRMQAEFEAEHQRMREQHERMKAELAAQRAELQNELDVQRSRADADKAAAAARTEAEARRDAQEEARLVAIEEARRLELEAQRAERAAAEAAADAEVQAEIERQAEADRRNAAEAIAIEELERVREEALRVERASTAERDPAITAALTGSMLAVGDVDLPVEKIDSRSLEVEAAMTPQPVIVASGEPDYRDETDLESVEVMAVGGAAEALGTSEAGDDDDLDPDGADDPAEDPSATSGLADYGFFGREEDDLYDSIYADGEGPSASRLPTMVALLVTGLILAAVLAFLLSSGAGGGDGSGGATMSELPGRDLGGAEEVLEDDVPIAAPSVDDQPDELAAVPSEGTAVVSEGSGAIALAEGLEGTGAAAETQAAVEATDEGVAMAYVDAVEAVRSDAEEPQPAIPGMESALETPPATADNDDDDDDGERRRARRERERDDDDEADEPRRAEPEPENEPEDEDEEDEEEPERVAAREEPDDEEVADALRRAQREYDSGDFGDAAELLRGVIEAEPRNGDALFLMGSSLYEQGDEREAVRYLERATRVNRRNADAFLLLGSAQQVVNDVGGAREAYERYLELEPDGSMAEEIRQILDQQL